MAIGFQLFVNGLNAAQEGWRTGKKEAVAEADAQAEREWLEAQRQRKLAEQTMSDEDRQRKIALEAEDTAWEREQRGVTRDLRPLVKEKAELELADLRGVEARRSEANKIEWAKIANEEDKARAAGLKAFNEARSSAERAAAKERMDLLDKIAGQHKETLKVYQDRESDLRKAYAEQPDNAKLAQLLAEAETATGEAIKGYTTTLTTLSEKLAQSNTDPTGFDKLAAGLSGVAEAVKGRILGATRPPPDWASRKPYVSQKPEVVNPAMKKIEEYRKLNPNREYIRQR